MVRGGGARRRGAGRRARVTAVRPCARRGPRVACRTRGRQSRSLTREGMGCFAFECSECGSHDQSGIVVGCVVKVNGVWVRGAYSEYGWVAKPKFGREGIGIRYSFGDSSARLEHFAREVAERVM